MEGRAHGCHMFVVDKHLADGTFDKCKGRVVLHGKEQDPEMYPDHSSPTAVAVHSIFACLTIAAHRGIKEVAKIHVKGAFIQTPMEGPPVYMHCSKELTQLIVEVYPHLKTMTKVICSVSCSRPCTDACKLANCGSTSLSSFYEKKVMSRVPSILV